MIASHATPSRAVGASVLACVAILGAFSLPASAAGLPGPFEKMSPARYAVNQPENLLLTWSASADAATYEYCVGTDVSGGPDGVCDTWVSTTGTSAVVAGLTLGSKYTWQVRARNASGVTNSDQGSWEFFTVRFPAGVYLLDDMEGPLFDWNPGEFAWRLTGAAHSGRTAWTDRPSPSYGINTTYYLSHSPIDLGAAVRPELRFWNRRNFGTNGSDAGEVVVYDNLKSTYTSLARFLDTDPTWKEVRLDLSAFAGARSISIAFLTSGAILDREGWSIDDVRVAEPSPPTPFGKTTPATGRSSAAWTLSWESNADAIAYEYCVDAIANNVCDGSWTSVGSFTSVVAGGLSIGSTYNWQVRARYSRGVIEADGGTWWTFTFVPFLTDFNRDSKPDLIWSNDATGELAAWNMGGGAYGEHILGGRYLNASPLPSGWRVAGAGDVDGDGQTDLFLQSDTGLLGVWVFDGVTLRYGITLNPGQVDPQWQIRAVGDLNHDGHPDLVWQYAPTGQVAFWLLNGTTAIAYVIPDVAAPGADWEIVGTGYSNRDGERDLFWQRRSTGTLAVWRMRGTTVEAGLLLSASPDPRWQAVSVADLDGDAFSDLVFQHTDTGQLAAWYLRDAAVRFGANLNPASAGDPAWKIVGPR